MQPTTMGIEDVGAKHQEIVARLRRSSEAIADEILKFERRNSAVIRTQMHDLDEQVRRFFRDFPILTAAQMKARAEGRPEGDEGPGIDAPQWAALMAEVNQTRLAINRWREIRLIVEAQVETRQTPLYRPPADAFDITGAQLEEVSMLVARLTKVLNGVEQDKDTHAGGAFADIPLPHADFLAHLHAAYRLRLAQDEKGPSYFIDVGCGGGMKVFQAGRFFDRALGIELDPGYVSVAERFLGAAGHTNCQALAFDALEFPSYGDFHVIYFYRPIRKRELLNKLEAKIAADARRGAILIAPYQFFVPVAEALDCRRVGEAVYVKGYTQDEAEALVRRAETTGPMIRTPLPPLMHVWDPILRASAKRGFGLSI
ncbi:MAG: class I SAM-dependent methyltransferase [Pseudomonadota bacterium]